MSSIRPRRRGCQRGSTLLELAVALAIALLALAATGAVVDGAGAQRARLDERGAELRSLFRFKRALGRDLRAMVTGTGGALAAGLDSLTVRCRGDVLFGQRLGARVVVRYHWEGTGDGATLALVRTVARPDDGRPGPAWTERLSEGLVGIGYEVTDGERWSAPGGLDPAAVRALRWRLEYRHIGAWELVQPVAVASDA